MISDDLILCIYFVGLFLSCAIGVWGYLAIRTNLKRFLHRVAPALLGSLTLGVIKIGLVATVLVGGMTSKYYGCSYEYSHLKETELSLFGELTGQMSTSIDALTGFLLILLVFSLLCLVIMVRTGGVRAR